MFLVEMAGRVVQAERAAMRVLADFQAPQRTLTVLDAQRLATTVEGVILDNKVKEVRADCRVTFS